MSHVPSLTAASIAAAEAKLGRKPGGRSEENLCEGLSQVSPMLFLAFVSCLPLASTQVEFWVVGQCVMGDSEQFNPKVTGRRVFFLVEQARSPTWGTC